MEGARGGRGRGVQWEKIGTTVIEQQQNIQFKEKAAPACHAEVSLGQIQKVIITVPFEELVPELLAELACGQEKPKEKASGEEEEDG